jgi:predicted metal-dependent peptidase
MEVNKPSFLAGMFFMKNGALCMGYNPFYIDKMSPDQIKFILIHEIQHKLSNHPQRALALGLKQELSNIASDMIINTNIDEAFKLPRPEYLIKDPKTGKEVNVLAGVSIPPEYKDERVMELLYDWILENMPPEGKDGKGNGDGSGNKKITIVQKNPDTGETTEEEVDAYVDGKGNVYIDKGEANKGAGIEDEIPQDLQDAILDDMIKTAQSRGYTSSNDNNMLGKIRRSKKNYLAIIKAYVSTMLGTQKKTSFQRFSRKYDLMPGFHRVKKEITCILDTSGSMSGMFEKVLAYIFYHDICINMIQCDTEVKQVIKCSCPSDVQKMKIQGLGGTVLQPAIDFVAKDKNLNAMPLVVLTDGYCDSLNFNAIRNKVLAITCGDDIPMSGKQVKQIKVEKH